MWRYGTGLLPATPAQFAAVTLKSFLTMDDWLSDLVISAPKETLNAVRSQDVVVQARPAEAVDLCYLTGDTTFSTPVTDMAVCDADPRLAKHASPRQVAGGPLAEDILKCQLKPLDAAQYAPGVFTLEQWARLQAAFPDGVCDWSRPGIGCGIGPASVRVWELTSSSRPWHAPPWPGAPLDTVHVGYAPGDRCGQANPDARRHPNADHVSWSRPYRGDLEVYLPRENIMWMSEVFFNRLYPPVGGGFTAFPTEWIETIKKAEALKAGLYVPNHGFVDSPRVLNEEIVNFRRALENVVSEAKRLHAAGASLEVAYRSVNLGEFQYWYRAANNMPDVVRKVYAEEGGRELSCLR